MWYGSFFLINNKKQEVPIITRSSKRINYTEECNMNGSQIERLKRDCREIEHFIKRQEKRGNNKKAYILKKKYDYMKSRIDEMEELLSA